MGVTVHFEVLNQSGTPMMYSSSLATQPAAGIQGRIFFRTDSPYGIYRDNGTTWDQIAGSGVGGITGSGTATQIAYFNSATSLASSANLFWDNTNARLGINTSSPGSSLDIHSAVQSVIQANNTTLGNSFASFQLQGNGKWQIGNVYNSGANYFRIQDQLNSVERLTIKNTGEINILGYQQTLNTLTGITGTSPSALVNSSFSNNFTFNSGITTSASVNTIGLLTDNILNYSGANTINVTSYNATVLQRNNLTFGTAAASITYTQATGIRALTNTQNQYIQNGANNGTISHYANLQILGDQKTGAGLTTFTNRYGILINDFNEFTAGNTYTNRWGIFQQGINENNFFAGKVGIGSGYVPSGYQLDVTGQTRIQTILNVGSSITVGTSAFPSRINAYGGASNLIAIYNILDGSTDNLGAFGACNIGSLGNIANLSGSGKYYQNLYIKSFITTSYNLAEVNEAVIATSINGTSTGIMRGLFINPTITSGGTGWLAIQSTIGGAYFNTASVVGSAILQADSTIKGFLPPRMTTGQKNAIVTPAAGLMIYDTTLAKLCVFTTAWETITSS